MRFILSLSLFLLAITPLKAQVGNLTPQEPIADPTEWKLSAHKLDNKTYELIFQVTLQKGWHLFSLNPGAPSLIPPSFSFTPDKKYKKTGTITEEGNLEEANLEGFDMKVRYFEGEVRFTQKVILKENGMTISGTHTYQVCNDVICLPPTVKPFEFRIP